MSGRPLGGYAAAFLAGAAVRDGALLAGSPWPPVRVTPTEYERQIVRITFASAETRLNPLLREGWAVERVDRIDPDVTAYVLRRQRP